MKPEIGFDSREQATMSLGIADHVWSLGELIDATLANVPPDCGRSNFLPQVSKKRPHKRAALLRPRSSAVGATDGVIGRPAFRSLEILGAALQADGETRSAFAASSIRRRSAAWTILPD